MYVALEKYRLYKKVSQKDLSKALGVSVRQWQRMANGESVMNMIQFKLACDHLGLSFILIDKNFLL